MATDDYLIGVEKWLSAFRAIVDRLIYEGVDDVTAEEFAEKSMDQMDAIIEGK